MTSPYKNAAFAVCLLAGSAVSAYAQAGIIPSVKDVDQEARNAYQTHCSIETDRTVAVCAFPALPEGKRLAIRWLSVYCLRGGSRVAGIELNHPLSASDPIFALTTRFRGGLESFGLFGERILEQPVYGHADRTPSIEVSLRAVANTDSHCTFAIRGYLVNRQ